MNTYVTKNNVNDNAAPCTSRGYVPGLQAAKFMTPVQAALRTSLNLTAATGPRKREDGKRVGSATPPNNTG